MNMKSERIFSLENKNNPISRPTSKPINKPKPKPIVRPVKISDSLDIKHKGSKLNENIKK